MKVKHKHIRQPHNPLKTLCGEAITNEDYTAKAARRVQKPFAGICPECVKLAREIIFG